MRITLNLDESLLNEAPQLINLFTQKNWYDRAIRRTSLILQVRFNLPRTSITRLCVRLVVLLIDASVLISVLRDRTGQFRQRLEIHDRKILLTRFTQMNSFKGA